jgi:hypothetical protein
VGVVLFAALQRFDSGVFVSVGLLGGSAGGEGREVLFLVLGFAGVSGLGCILGDD